MKRATFSPNLCKMTDTFNKKIATGVLMFFFANAIMFGGGKSAYALIATPVADPAAVPTGDKSLVLNTFQSILKEYTFDALVNSAMKVVISNITQSIVAWINSGFRGSPAFITNPERYLVDVADQIAGDFIAGGELGFMCEPFQLDLRIALNINYSATFTERNFCRLSDVVSNTEDFAKFTEGDFSKGGWNSWFEISQNPSNNPFGSYVSAQGELADRILKKQDQEKNLLNWGDGFLSFRECLAEDQNRNCVEEGDIQTPGKVINEQLNLTLGTGIRQLELADEIDEIVGALVGQIAKTVLTEGLSTFGVGESNSRDLRHEADDNSRVVVSCQPDKRNVAVGEKVAWSARVLGVDEDLDDSDNDGPELRYAWSGDEIDDLFGFPIGQTFEMTYTSSGIKSASVRVTVTESGENITEQCNTSVEVR